MTRVCKINIDHWGKIGSCRAREGHGLVCTHTSTIQYIHRWIFDATRLYCATRTGANPTHVYKFMMLQGCIVVQEQIQRWIFDATKLCCATRTSTNPAHIHTFMMLQGYIVLQRLVWTLHMYMHREFHDATRLDYAMVLYLMCGGLRR